LLTIRNPATRSSLSPYITRAIPIMVLSFRVFSALIATLMASSSVVNAQRSRGVFGGGFGMMPAIVNNPRGPLDALTTTSCLERKLRPTNVSSDASVVFKVFPFLSFNTNPDGGSFDVLPDPFVVFGKGCSASQAISATHGPVFAGDINLNVGTCMEYEPSNSTFPLVLPTNPLTVHTECALSTDKDSGKGKKVARAICAASFGGTASLDGNLFNPPFGIPPPTTPLEVAALVIALLVAPLPPTIFNNTPGASSSLSTLLPSIDDRAEYEIPYKLCHPGKDIDVLYTGNSLLLEANLTLNTTWDDTSSPDCGSFLTTGLIQITISGFQGCFFLSGFAGVIGLAAQLSALPF